MKPTQDEVLDRVPDSIARRNRRDFPAGTVLMHQGDPSDCFYYLLSGRVRVDRRGTDGEKIQVAVLGPGNVTGQRGLLTGRPRSATVTAIEDTTALELRPRRTASWKPLPASMDPAQILMKIMRQRHKETPL